MEPERIGEDVELYLGDCRAVLPLLAAGSAKCCVTSPPYWGGLRDYGHPGQIGLERNPSDYVDVLSAVFVDIRRVLADDGTLWLNVGDVYAASGKGGGGSAGTRGSWDTVRDRKGFRMPPEGYKQKDLTLVPMLLADRLRRDGWYLRQTVIWSKPSATEPKRLDRPSVSHEYLFLFAASEQYAARDPGEDWWGQSVWTIQPEADPGHPAVMPAELVRRCVLSSSSEGDAVIDPFAGSGMVGRVCSRWGRRFIGIEISDEHYATARRRLTHATGAGEGQLFGCLGEETSRD